MWQWSCTLSSPSGFVHIWQLVVLVNDCDSVAVSSIGFGVAIYSSNNCLASSCSLRTNISAASSPLYMKRLWKICIDTAYYLVRKTTGDRALGKRETKILCQFLHLAVKSTSSLTGFRIDSKSAYTTKGCWQLLLNVGKSASWILGELGSLYMSSNPQHEHLTVIESSRACRHCLQQ